MSLPPPLHPETLALHAGYTPEPTTGSRAVPIYQTASYRFASADHAAALFALEQPGNIYTRIQNPTTEVFEKRIAALEGGAAALAVASGQAAETVALLALLRAGDEVLSATSIYGGTYSLLHHTLPRFGITTRFVDFTNPAAVRAALTPRTRVLFCESLGNPGLDIADLPALATIAHEAGLPLVVDNTAATPALLRPIEHGADIVIHSATKFIGGHGQAIGGVIIDAGRFDWTGGRFPEFTEPNPAYHGLRLVERFGALSFIVKARVETLRDLGACLAPFNAHAFINGLETLHLRVRRQSESALAVAHWLERDARVAWVRYPGLAGDRAHAAARRFFAGGFGALVTFGVRGGPVAGKALIDRVRLWSLLANIGDARSLVIHPASTTHSQLTPEQQLVTGVTPDLVRLSVGLEHPADLLADLDQALECARARAA